MFIELFLTLAPAIQSDPSPGFTLYGPSSSTETRLLDEDGSTQHTWPSTSPAGLSVYLLDNGDILRAEHPPGFGGGSGAGGRVRSIAWDGTVVWEYDYGPAGVLQHHDIEPMPNGNVLMIAWEDKTQAEAIQAGRNPAFAPFTFKPDHIIEVQPTGPSSGTIVWEWHAWDHLIQDFDPTKDNFGVVADNPQLVDINYPSGGAPGGDWMHVNSVDYNPVLDQILLSVHFLDEIWVIDHSTTTAEAAGHTGGNSGKGGDILYRWGTPAAYGAPGAKTLAGQHDVNWIPPGYPGAGNILIFSNNAGQITPPFGVFSSVLEIVPPTDGGFGYTLTPGQAYGPAGPVWEYTAPVPSSFFSSIMSGCERLPNGNTLICSATQGRLFEVNPAKELVWEKAGLGTVFKARRYERYLWIDGTDEVSASGGGSVEFELVAGSPHAGRLHLLLGSTGGTTPGLTYGGVTLPLNPVDAYFNLTLTAPGAPPLTGAFGTLDAAGRSTATFALPVGSNPALVGLTVHHAFGVFDATGAVFLASNADDLAIVP